MRTLNIEKTLNLIVYGIILLIFIFNFLPTLEIGFYQDDFKSFLEPVQRANGEISNLLFKDVLGAGVRPLLFLDRFIFWEIFGENYIAHRIYLGLVHLLYGLLVYKLVKLLIKDHLLSLLASLFYFSMVFTRQTIYSSVAMNPADLGVFLSIYLTLNYYFKGNLTYNKIWFLFFIYIFSLLYKENGIATFPCVLLIYLYDYKIIFKDRKTQVHLLGMFLITIAYLAFYYFSTSQLEIDKRTLQSTTLTWYSTKNFLFGTVQSFFAPFINMFKILRVWFDVSTGPSIIATSGALAISSVVILKNFIKEYGLKRIIVVSIWVYAIIASLLVPYILNSYFEERMMVVSFAIGMIMWSIAFALTYKKAHSSIEKGILVLTLLILTIPSVGRGVQYYIHDELSVSNRLRKLVNKSDLKEGDIVCIEGFGNEVLMRNGNALGLVRYETQNKVKVTECENLEHDVELDTSSGQYPNIHILKAERINDSISFTLTPYQLAGH